VANSYTEASCVAACGASTTCLSCDYNFQNSLCFFGTTLNPATTSNSATDHYDFVKTCGGGVTGITTSSSCAPTVTQKTGQNAPGLTQQGVPNTYTEQGCVSACDATPSCLSCDYNKQTFLCFFGTTQNPATVANSAVDHYDLVYPTSCGGQCTATYTTTQKALQNAPGLTQQGVANSYTEASCVAACGASTTCLSCDYNFQNNLCFFGTTQNPATISNSATDHYDFVKTCNNGGATGVPTTCTPTVTQKVGQNVPGLIQQGVANTYTEQGCVSACDASPSCLSCDYNKQNFLCYFGTTQNPATVANSAVDHYDLVYPASCSNTGSCTVTATLTVGVATPGLTQQGVAGTYTEATCLSTCKASTTCLVVDFNTSNQLCYFGTTANPATSSNSVVDHYTITRTNCAG
jgi:ABC-type uncharacterized transport system auxiliary subunit